MTSNVAILGLTNKAIKDMISKDKFTKIAMNPDPPGRFLLHDEYLEDEPHEFFIRELLKYHPDRASRVNNNGEIPLHCACQNIINVESSLMTLLLESNLEGTHVANDKGNLPIHKAVAVASAVIGGDDLFSLIQRKIMKSLGLVLEVYPEALNHRNIEGQVPLHIAVSRPSYISLSVIQLLVQYYPESANITDVYGQLPLHKSVQSVDAFAGNKLDNMTGYLPHAIVGIAFNFILMILNASYTASLASFLISQNAPTYPLSSIDDASAKGARICVQTGYTSYDILTKYYPNIRVMPYPSPAYYQAVLNGTCDGGVASYSILAPAMIDKTINPDCSLVQVGPPIRIYSGAFPFIEDYSIECTSFLNEMLSIGFLQIQDDGTMQNLWSQAMVAANTLTCSTSTTQSTTTSNALTELQMAGVFVIFCIAIGCGLLLHIIILIKDYIQNKLNKVQNNDNDDEENYISQHSNSNSDLDSINIGIRSDQLIQSQKDRNNSSDRGFDRSQKSISTKQPGNEFFACVPAFL